MKAENAKLGAAKRRVEAVSGPELPELLLGLRLLVRMGDQRLLSVRGLRRHAVRRGAVRVVGDPRATLRWRDLLSGEAAMAVALNASLTRRQTATQPETEQSPDRTSKRVPKKRAR